MIVNWCYGWYGYGWHRGPWRKTETDMLLHSSVEEGLRVCCYIDCSALTDCQPPHRKPLVPGGFAADENGIIH